MTRAKMSSMPRKHMEVYNIYVNGIKVNEVWNGFRSWSSALEFLSKNYGILVGINFLMDDISIKRTAEEEYSVDFE